MEFKPHPYQQRAIEWIMTDRSCGLFLDMGLGKSVITLTALARMIDCCEIEHALIVAPKTVAESTWPAELAKWDHLRGLTMNVIAGGYNTRLGLALNQKCDIDVVSRDNFLWMAEETGFARRGVREWSKPHYDVLVIDELSSFRTPSSLRFKALKKYLRMFRRVIGLTGTPAPNGLLNLWSQVYALDEGARLGKTITGFKEKYFTWRVCNNIRIDFKPRPGAQEQITALLSDLCLSMKAEDYLTMPPLSIIDKPAALDGTAMDRYRAFARDAVMALGDGEVVADSAAALCNKLSQFANGAIYTDAEGNYREVHSHKLEVLSEIIEGADSPVLVFYQYKSDAQRIISYLSSRRDKLTVRAYNGDAELRAWNAGNIDVLLAHPASTAYGLNMQQGGHSAVWFGTGWNLELYTQANARLYRQGQKKPVFVYNIIAPGTVDERALAALRDKETTQAALMKAVAAVKAEVSRNFL